MHRLVVFLVLIGAAAAIPIDNGVQGDPEIECGPTSIQATFNTQNNFEGHVYVKGLYDQDANGCRTSGAGDRAVAGIELPFNSCNVERTRSANPKGIFVRVTLVISFHPNFITKVDRAYTLQCFYMEADKTVSTDIEVSMITTGFQTQFVPMPICRYEILDSPAGNQVQYALIGQAVYHKWTCDTETIDTFCMFVYGCYVVDPAGNDRLDLIDGNGCATDRYLMGNIEYPTDLMGIKEVHVFKYADRPALFFQCQISISVKEPNADCVRPVCADPDGLGGGRQFGFNTARATNRRSFQTQLRTNFNVPRTVLTVSRGKRSVEVESAAIVDVNSRLEALDVDESHDVLPADLTHRVPLVRHLYAPVDIVQSADGVCMSPITLVAFIVVDVILMVAMITASVMMHRRTSAH